MPYIRDFTVSVWILLHTLYVDVITYPYPNNPNAGKISGKSREKNATI